jgi:hypothetical protein
MLICLSACAAGQNTAVLAGGGVVMAYEIAGRVTNDDIACGAGVGDVSVALFDQAGALLDETRTDQQGHFLVGVRNPDAAEGMLARLDNDDPTVSVSIRVQPPGRTELRYNVRLPRPVAAREYRVRLATKKAKCDD